MNRQKLIITVLMIICFAGLAFLFSASGMADEHRGRSHFEREDQHSFPFSESDNEGNETAGQIVAFLLIVANFPVTLSVLIKSTNRFLPTGADLAKSLLKFNRIQKKALMWLHYYLNLASLGIAAWHWLASRCKSSALPELGLMIMVTLIASGFLIKFKLCPKVFRKNIYQIHTQPIVFTAMILVLTVGHLIVD